MLNSSQRADVFGRLGRALSDPTRMRILIELLEGPTYPAALARCLGLTRSNVSNHLACLRGCGLVVAEPQGRQVRYEIADPHLTRAIEQLVRVVIAVDEGAPCVDDGCDAGPCCSRSAAMTGAGA
ncbi:metalloregulator ArsR/SmtB family transcription factor [Phycicoccus jejuensis]|jgi:DNA-binding transcriptional ArsR family regulator|uniref:Cd(II)/Pb(II)-sensing metalloregulatory transcriptional regulator CmtR n=1 Tax=Phycicoccus jejuensis TaxID=367299 RepID=UPI00384C168B